MAKRKPPTPRKTGRLAAVRAITGAVRTFPNLEPVTVNTRDLDLREGRLAQAITRTVLKRWLTLEHLLDHHLRQPMRRLEPAVAAVLLTGAAQILFMERLPVHAIVDEAVSLARVTVRGGAAGLVNAVLRRISESLAQIVTGQAYEPAPDRLPVDDGFVKLSGALLPAVKTLDKHLSIATSHPLFLVRRWLEAHGDQAATELCIHSQRDAPIILSACGVEADVPDRLRPHEQAGFHVWTGDHSELLAFLAEHPTCRVQDPTAARPVMRTAGMRLDVIVDYCAGRGTKTRQLAALHPQSRIFAYDIDKHRRAALRDVARSSPQVAVVEPDAIDAKADLILLDVPCSNTGVLARRPEARYRLSHVSLESVCRLQRDIATAAMDLLGPGGLLLYSTCSIEPEENRRQVEWITERFGLEVVDEQATVPGGSGTSYHDGGYWALLRR